MKRIISYLLTLSVLMSCLFIPVIADDSDATIIRTGAEFVATTFNDAAKTYSIEGIETLADGSKGIVLPSDYTSKTSITGIIKGVSGKNNIQLTNEVPLFASFAANTVVIENIVLKGPDSDGGGLVAGSSYNGALLSVSQTAGNFTIKNVTNYLDVNGSYTGGLIGYLRRATLSMEGCINFGTVTGTGYAGGMLGWDRELASTTYTSCINYGSVNGTHAGGILGFQNNTTNVAKFIKCANYGILEGTKGYSGGIAGALYAGEIEKSFNAGKVTSTNLVAGILGYAGANGGKISNCFNAGIVTGTDDNDVKKSASGIVCINNSDKWEIENCYNIGVIKTYSTEFGYDIAWNACKAESGNYYVTSSDSNISGLSIGTSLASLDALKSLPNEFSQDVWEMVTVCGNNVEYYMYPQIKGNTYWYDYKYLDNYKGNVSNKSATVGNITNVVAGWEVKENVANLENLYSTSEKGYQLSSEISYSDLTGSTIIRGDYTDTSSQVSFTIDKTAEIIIATSQDPSLSTVDAVSEGGFTQLTYTDNSTVYPVTLVTKAGIKYYLSSKVVTASAQAPQTVTIPAAGSDLDNAYVLFVNWFDTYTVSFDLSGNEKVYINNVLKNDSSAMEVIAGRELKVKVEPNADYYIKEVTVNNVLEEQNQTGTYEDSFVVDKNFSIKIVSSEYKFTGDGEPVISIVQEDDPVTGLPSQSLKIKGNLGSFLSGKTVDASLDKNSSFVASSSGVIGADGIVEIIIPLGNSDNGIHNIGLTVNVDGIDKNIAISNDKKTYNIPTVADIIDLLTKLNATPKEITLTELKALILEEKESLAFDAGVFKYLDENIKDAILAPIINGSGFTASTLYDMYSDNVIMKTANMSSKAEDFERLISEYGSKIGITSSPLYTEYSALSSKTKACSVMQGIAYSNYSDIVNQFEYSYCHSKLSSVASYDNIIDELDTYKTILGVESQVATALNKVDAEIKIINEGIGSSLNELKTKALLTEKLNYLIANSSTLAQDKINSQLPPVILPSQPSGNSGGGGGGGGSVTVGKEYTDEVVLPEITEGNEAFGDLGSVLWAQGSINNLYKKGIVSGKSIGRFYPEDKVTRAEFVKMIMHAFNLSSNKKGCEFTDVSKDHWAYEYIEDASSLGIISGYSDTIFGTEGNITRQDTAAIIIRIIYKLSLYETIENRKDPDISYSDFSDIDAYALGGVNMLSGCGILSGYEDGTFGPKKEVTRAEAAVIIDRTLNFFGI